jgi:hypothetical protein
MRRYANHLNKQDIGHKPINHPPLLIEPRRTATLPFPSQRLTVKSFNSAQPPWTGKAGDVLPFLVALEDIQGDAIALHMARLQSMSSTT